MLILRLLFSFLVVPFLAVAAPPPAFQEYGARWEQADAQPGVVLGIERDVFEPADKVGRFVVAVQAGKNTEPSGYEGRWTVTHAGGEVASGKGSLWEGMLVVDFPLDGLAMGDYEVSAEVLDGVRLVGGDKRIFKIRPDSGTPPPTHGRVPLILPSGVPGAPGGYPLTFGIPFPKGALADLSKLRVTDAKGAAIPAQFVVRSRWDYAAQAGIRWLGIDFQSSGGPAWWPDRSATPYFLEFGQKENVAPRQALDVKASDEGIRVNTGPLQFLVRSGGFNLLDEVVLNGVKVLDQGGRGGAYLVDQEGAIYRAANDKKPTLQIEESGPLRSVIRVEGWYVKDGTSGDRKDFRLPTDALCKFITRLEVYAGLPWVRVLHTWVITADSYSVFFNDVGMSLIRPGNTEARFGVEGSPSVAARVGPKGVYLLQHLPGRFDVCRGDGKELASGARSTGTVSVSDLNDQLLTVSHRETWQRFPKEIEVLPDEIRLHIWPAHGRDHPEIDPYAKKTYHQLWFAHQGKLLDLRFPWESLLTVMRLSDNPSTQIYKPAGTAMGGVHSSAMGAAITSDLMIRFGICASAAQADADTAAFQAAPLAAAHPQWVADSQVLGPIHPYDPETFPEMEKVARDAMFGVWDLQDATGQYGMFLYRGWHHSAYLGDGYWDPYRLYSAGHHNEPYLPWLYYARSGDPRFAQMAMVGMRHLTDLGIVHYDDPAYEHKEFNSGQKRLLGSTRHTNGFVLWGGDHAILGHLTSYNAVMLAYYLTGDLRFREVVVDEWKYTLLDDRKNPEWAKASRMNWGRNVNTEINRENNHALGEMLDLYQLTYDPRLLAFIQPCVQSMEQNMFPWSLELEKVLAFRRTPLLRTRLLEAAALRRQDPKGDKWKALGFRPDARLALAAHEDPTQGYEVDALVAFDLPNTSTFADSFQHYDKPSMAACNIPDRFLAMPLLLAVAKPLYQPVEVQAPAGERPLPLLPLADQGASRIVVRESTDSEIIVCLRGLIRSKEAWLKILDASGKILHNGSVPPGGSFTVKIPKDGVAGQYVILATVKDGKDFVLAPVTNLPGEVYAPSSTYWAASFQEYFLGAPNTADGKVRFAPGSNTFVLETVDRKTVLAERTKENASADLVCAMPPDGLWFVAKGRYFSTAPDIPLLMALTPESFFSPSAEVLKLQ